MTELDEHQIRLLRLRGQRLRLASSATVPDVVGEVFGLQAQDAAAAILGVRSRSKGLRADDVERARLEDRSLVRSWFMRGTIHLVASEDIGMLQTLLSNILHRATLRRLAQLGLDEDRVERGVKGLRQDLASGPKTKAELEESLASRDIPTDGQKIVHIIGQAAAAGLVCVGPWRGNKQTYVLLEDWLKPFKKPSREDALAEMARRYLAAYGPARPEDLAAWSGLGLGDARAGWKSIAAELLEVMLPDGPAWLLQSRADWLKEKHEEPVVNLAPAFDTYLLGYKGRRLAVADHQHHHVLPGGGMIAPVLLVDGVVHGTWHAERRPKQLAITVTPFDELAPDIVAAIEPEAEDIGRFLAQKTTLTIK